LTGLAGRLDAVPAAVGEDPSNEQALIEFARATNDQVSLEHETKATQEAMGKLDEALAKINLLGKIRMLRPPRARSRSISICCNYVGGQKRRSA
jgi:hypothetical protein